MSRYRDRMGNDRKTKREIGRRLRRGSVMMCMMITSAMLVNATTLDGYYVNGDGVWVQ